jgi:hypothetical protein
MSNVTQFMPGAIKAIYRGTIAIANTATSNTATITAVNTDKAILHHLGVSSTENNNGYTEVRLALTNTTTITATRGGNVGDVTVGYQLVEYV